MVDEVARDYNTNRQYVQRAVRLKRAAPDLHEQVKAGAITPAERLP